MELLDSVPPVAQYRKSEEHGGSPYFLAQGSNKDLKIVSTIVCSKQLMYLVQDCVGIAQMKPKM